MNLIEISSKMGRYQFPRCQEAVSESFIMRLAGVLTYLKRQNQGKDQFSSGYRKESCIVDVQYIFRPRFNSCSINRENYKLIISTLAKIPDLTKERENPPKLRRKSILISTKEITNRQF